jgi:hypothetical protein
MTARLIVLGLLCLIGFLAFSVGYALLGGFVEHKAKERWPERKRLISAVSWVAIGFPGLVLVWLCGGLTVGGGA